MVQPLNSWKGLQRHPYFVPPLSISMGFLMILPEWKTTYFMKPVTAVRLLYWIRIWLCHARTVYLLGSATWAGVGEMGAGFTHMRQSNWQLNI